MKPLNITMFVKSYLATAAWVTIEAGECDKFTREAQNKARQDCQKFIDTVVFVMGENEAQKVLNIAGNDLDYLAPHDLFLTRNGHGAGFWDKEDIYGEENAATLTKIAKEMGTSDCFHIGRGRKSRLILC